MRAVRAPADAGLASKRTTSVEGGHPGRLRSSGGIYTAVHPSATNGCGWRLRPSGGKIDTRQLPGLLVSGGRVRGANASGVAIYMSAGKLPYTGSFVCRAHPDVAVHSAASRGALAAPCSACASLPFYPWPRLSLLPTVKQLLSKIGTSVR